MTVELSIEEKIRRAAQCAHILFMANGWQWDTGTGRSAYTPTVSQIEETYRDLIKIVPGCQMASTGRLTVVETDLGTELMVDVGVLYPNDSTESPEGSPEGHTTNERAACEIQCACVEGWCVAQGRWDRSKTA